MNYVYDYGNLWPVAILKRAPLALGGQARIHEMILTSGSVVFHNTPERGEHLTTLEDALRGLDASQHAIPENVQAAAYQRLMAAIRNPRPYDAFLNNCQHTVNRIVYGKAESRTLQGIVTIGVVSAFAFFALRG